MTRANQTLGIEMACQDDAENDMNRPSNKHHRSYGSERFPYSTPFKSVRVLWTLALLIVVGTVEASRKGGAAPLERGKEIGRVVTAKDLYNAYQEIQHEYREKAFGSNGWKILNKKDGIEIAMMQHKSDPTCPYVRMTAIMPTPVIDCWNFLRLANWDRTMPKMDPFYEGLTVFGEYRVAGVYMLLARKRTKRVFAFGKRDFVFVSVSDVPQLDGTWVSGTVSVRTPQVPRRKGYTRAYQDSVAFYKPIDNGKKTHLTIVCRIDMNDSTEGGEGGFMPMWIYVKTIGKIGAQSVKNMRKCLEEEVKAQAKRDTYKERGVLPSWLKPKPDDEGEFERESFADQEDGGIRKGYKQRQSRVSFRWTRPWKKESVDESEEEPSAMTPTERLPYSLWRQGKKDDESEEEPSAKTPTEKLPYSLWQQGKSDDKSEEEPSAMPPTQRLPYSLWQQGKSSS